MNDLGTGWVGPRERDRRGPAGGSSSPLTFRHRSKALDHVKGMNVVAMIAYHVTTIADLTPAATQFITGCLLNYVSGSFVFLAGMVVALRYWIEVREGNSQAGGRLFGKGLKLAALFILLNVAISLLSLRAHSWEATPHVLFNVFVLGSGTFSSFEILLGIAYTMIVSALFFQAGRFFVHCVILSLIVIGLWSLLGPRIPANVWMVTCGLVGILLGLCISNFVDDARFQTLVRPSFLAAAGGAASFSFVYLACTSDVGRNDIWFYAALLIAVNGFIAGTYKLFRRFPAVTAQISALGQYPLISYIVQMGIIYAIAQLLRASGTTLSYGLAFIIVLSCTLAFVAALRIGRRKSQHVDAGYRLLF